MIAVTLITESNNYGFNTYLKPSCNFFNINLEVLNTKIYDNHRTKDKFLLSFLRSIPPDTIVLFTDGYDTAFLTGEAEIIKRYQESRNEILFSGERNCWPYEELASFYSTLKNATIGPLKYLNSGALIGKAGILIKILEKYNIAPSCHSIIDHIVWLYQSIKKREVIDPYVKYKWSNQFFWHQVFLKNQKIIGIDTNGSIFYSLSSPIQQNYSFESADQEIDHLVFRIQNELQKKDDRVFTPLTQNMPCHIHFNGFKIKSIMKSKSIQNLMPWL